ncbi:hypothetical protein H3C70_03345 [Patescibacteria group bacterium]|nr:hypothetical protein [Patescibacteria group bacterium]
MSIEFPLRSEVDRQLEARKQQRPLTMAQAKEITSAMEEQITTLSTEKSKQRELRAKIFHYLTAGSRPTTHRSGKPEGELGPFSKAKARERFQKSVFKDSK